MKTIKKNTFSRKEGETLIDEKLIAQFKDRILELKAQGHSDLEIRASFHEAAPKLLWQEKIYIGIVNGAATTYGLSLILVSIIFSIFLEPSLKIPVIFVLLFTGAFLYYFALGAFLFHAGKKLILTLVLSSVLTGFSWVILQAFEKFVVVATPLLAKIQSTATALNQIPQGILGEDIPVESIAQISGALDPTVLAHTVEFPVLMTLIFIAYNITPLFFLIREHIEARTGKKKQKSL